MAVVDLNDLRKPKEPTAEEMATAAGEVSNTFEAMRVFLYVLVKRLGGHVVITKDDVEEIVEGTESGNMYPHPSVKDAYVLELKEEVAKNGN